MLALSVMCCAFAAVAQTSDIAIKGKIVGIKKGRLYLIARTSEQTSDTLGFCDFKKGKFKMQAKANEPMVAQLVVEGFAGGFMLFAEPGVAYDACLSEGSDFYIKGGKLNDSYVAHMALSDSLRTVIAGLQERYDSLRAGKKLRSASQVNDSLKRERNNLRELTNSFLAANDNLISAYTVYSNIIMRDAGLRESRSMYSSLGSGAKATQYGRMIKERIDRLAMTDQGDRKSVV